MLCSGGGGGGDDDDGRSRGLVATGDVSISVSSSSSSSLSWISSPSSPSSSPSPSSPSSSPSSSSSSSRRKKRSSYIVKSILDCKPTRLHHTPSCCCLFLPAAVVLWCVLFCFGVAMGTPLSFNHVLEPSCRTEWKTGERHTTFKASACFLFILFCFGIEVLLLLLLGGDGGRGK